MARAVWTALGLGLGALALYFAFWPVPVDPVAWTPPPAPGYVGPFARDGRIYFSDASTRFGARQGGSTYSASLLEIIEHRGNGRLLVWDPATGKAAIVLRGIHFANGVALADDESYVLVSETGSYRVLRHWL